MALSAGSAVFIVWAMARASGGFMADQVLSRGELAMTLAFVAWNVLSCVGLGGVVLITDRKFRRGLGVIGLGAVVFAGVLTPLLGDFFRSESTTSALLFVTMPFVLWSAVAVTAAVGFVLRTLRGRRRIAAPDPLPRPVPGPS